MTDFPSDISAAPKVVARPRSFEATHKSNVTFHCNATGIPDPVISWSKEGSDIPVRHSAGVLSLTGVASDDDGRYICTAKNAAGTSTTSIELTVEGLLELRLKEKKSLSFPLDPLFMFISLIMTKLIGPVDNPIFSKYSAKLYHNQTLMSINLFQMSGQFTAL